MSLIDDQHCEMLLTDDQINNYIRCDCCERHNTNKPSTLEDYLNHHQSITQQRKNDDNHEEDNDDNYDDNNDAEHDEDNDDDNDDDNHNNVINNECVACVTDDDDNDDDNECNCRCRYELREHFLFYTLLNMYYFKS